MNVAPDVVGLQLKEAIELLELSEFKISIKKTQSPKAIEETGECRVIKQKNVNHNIELTISYF